MPIANPDFSGDSPNKPGDYLCQIVSTEMKTSKATNNCYISWKLKSVDGNRIIFHNTPLSGRAVGMFKRMVNAAGFPYTDGSFDTDLAIGKYVQMKLEVDERNFFKVIEVSAPDPATIPAPPSNPIKLNSLDEEDIPF